MADKEINCMVQAVISATGRIDLTDQLSDIRVLQKLANWGRQGYSEAEAQHLTELLETAGHPHKIKT